MTKQPEKPTILLIEDDEPMRRMMDQVLRTAGYRVLVAADATEAAIHWKRESAAVDLLLTDILLEGLSGPEIAREFRATRPNIKVMVISGSHEPAALDTVELADAKVFLAKPFNHRSLLQAVNDALGPDAR